MRGPGGLREPSAVSPRTADMQPSSRIVTRGLFTALCCGWALASSEGVNGSTPIPTPSPPAAFGNQNPCYW